MGHPRTKRVFRRLRSLRPPLRAGSGTPGHPRRAVECRLQVPLGRLRGALAAQTFPAGPRRSSPKSQCRCCQMRSAKRRRPLLISRTLSVSAQVPGGSPAAAAGAAEGQGRVCACAGKAALPAAAAAPPPPPARTARPRPRRRPEPPLSSLAFASRVAFPAALPPPAGLQGLQPSGSRRESGSERERGRAEAAGFCAAVRERGARGDAGPPLRICSLAPRLPHSARSHPFSA